MAKATIKLDTDTFVKLASKVGIQPKPARSLLKLLLDVKKSKPRKPKTRTPKLEAVFNPNSKYYDKTPKYTKRLALVWYNHQQHKKRLRHKRITPDNRQWVLLVQIKQSILDATGKNRKLFLAVSRLVFQEAEQLAAKQGRRHVYLTNIVHRMDELVDNAMDKLEAKVKTAEQKTWRAYRTRRSKFSGFDTLPKELQPGSDEHELIKKIRKIIKRYKTTSRIFMEIQFAAFAFNETFPRLKDLVTQQAIDRLEQGLRKRRGEVLSTEDEAYWDDVENSSNK